MRILIVTPYLPYPPNSGHPLRVYNLLCRIARENEIWLASFIRTSDDLDGLSHLYKYCAGIETANFGNIRALSRPLDALKYICKGKPPDLRIYESPELVSKINTLVNKIDFNVVNIEDSFMGIYWEILPPKIQRRSVLNFIDVNFMRYKRISQIEPRVTNKVHTWLYSFLMRRWEPYYAERFGKCITMSEIDRQLLLQANPRLKISVVPNGVDTTIYQPLPCLKQSPILIFVGNMSYRPNIDAVSYFYYEIYPSIKAELPQVEFWIVGKNPAPEVIRLREEGVQVTGQVVDLLPYYNLSTVCVVPLRAGGGTRLKILEAMALGRPVVSTSIGCEGLDVADDQHILIANDPISFAKKTLSLLINESLRQQLISQARELVVAKYDWAILAKKLSQIYLEVA